MAIKKIGTNKWCIRVSVHDKKKGYPVSKQETFKGIKAEAIIREAELLKEFKFRHCLIKQQAITFKDLIAMYLQKIEVRGRCSYSYRRMVELTARELGHLRIESFVDNFTVYCQTLANSLTVRGTPYTPTSINRLKAIVRAAFQHAVNLEILSRNPITQVKFPTFKEKPRDRVLTDEINTIREHKPQILPIIKFMAMVPCRTMELVVAKRKHYDQSSRTIYIPNSKAMIPIYKPVPQELYDYFDSLPEDCPYLFYYKNYKEEYRPLTHNLRNAWSYCCKKAGISNYRIHDLRHLSITKLVMAGNTDLDIADIAGWTSTAMFKVYYRKDSFRSAKRIRIPKFSYDLVE